MNKFIVSLALLLSSLGSYAQDNFGINLNVSVEKKFSKRFDGELSVDSRFQQDDYWYTERVGFGVGLGYKIVDTKKFDLKGNIGFEYLRQVKPQELEYTNKEKLKITQERKFNRARASLGFAAAFKPNKRWTFSLKETVQYNRYAKHHAEVCKFDKKLKDGEIYYDYRDGDLWYDIVENADDVENKSFNAKDRFILRNKLTIKYDIRHSIVSPYISGDYGCGLNYSTNKWKATIGTGIALSKMHNLDVFYRYQTEDDDDEPNGHLLGVGYILKF